MPHIHPFLGSTFCSILLSISLFGQSVPDSNAEQKKAAGDAASNQALELEKKADPVSLNSAIPKYEEARRLYREAGDRLGEGRVALSLGDVYLQLKQNEAAKKYLEEAVLIAKETGSAGVGGRASWGLGLVNESLNQNAEALLNFNQALSIFTVSQNLEGVRALLTTIGDHHRRLQQHAKSQDFYERALVAYRQAKDGVEEALLLSLLGDTHKKLLQYEKALSYYEKALAIAREQKSRDTEASLLIHIGDVYLDQNEFEKARSSYENSQKISREIKDQSRESDALWSLGYVSNRLKRHDKALEYFQILLKIRRENRHRPGEAWALYNLGLTYSYLRQGEKAISSYREGLEIARDVKIPSLELRSLADLGDVYYDLSQYDNARISYEQALAINNEKADKEREGRLLERLGDVHQNLNQYEKALPYFQGAMLLAREAKQQRMESLLLVKLGFAFYVLKQYDNIHENYAAALVAAKESKFLYGQSNALNSLGAFYLAVGQHGKAKAYFEEAAGAASEDKNNSEHAIALIGLGEVSNALKRSSEARAYLERGLKLARDEEDEFLQASSYIAIGAAHKNLGDSGSAIKNFELALALAKKARAVYQEAQAFNELGIVYSGLGQLEKARQSSERALILSREIRDPETEAYSLLNLMKVLDQTGSPQLGVFYGKQLINMVQVARAKFKNFDKDLQQSFLKDKEGYYRILADVLIAEGRLYEAQQVLDLLKSEEYKEITQRRSGEDPGTVPYSNAEGEALKYVENLATLERERAGLVKQQTIAPLPIDKQKQLEQLEGQIELANKSFRLAMEQLGKTEVRVENKVAEIQSQKNLQRTLAQLERETGSGVVALYTMLGEESGPPTKTDVKGKTNFGWIILVTPTSRKAYPIDVEKLEKAVFDLRDLLRTDKNDPRPLAKEIYDKLFRQTSIKQKTTLESDLASLLSTHKEKTLMWSLDGILRYVPTSALYDGKQYLIEKYRNVVFTKESFLTLAAKDAPTWRALGMGVSEQRETFPALPSVERELQDIVRPVGSSTGILDGAIKLNKSFTEEAALSLWRQGTYPVIHLASHYSFNVGDPKSSFLLVGDGHITFAEMQDKDNIFANVDLLTLSACDTAMGSGNGKEAEGFAYLAQNLGAKAVIASLWQVSDAGTSEFMVRFYKFRADNPTLTKGEAFRQAQLSLMRGKLDAAPAELTETSDSVSGGERLRRFIKNADAPYAHPYYWSPFVLIGNWR